VRITRVELFELTIPFVEPFIISGGRIDARRSLVVALHDDAGHVGYGESPPFELPFYSEETLAGARDLIARVLLPRIAGQEFDAPEAVDAVVRAGVRPEVPQPSAVEDPPGEIGNRSRNRPDRELADEAAHEADRPQQREQRREPAEGELPDPDRLEAEELVAQQPGRSRDHDQLEDRPAETLDHVQDGRGVRPALPERCALQHHRRHAAVGADQPCDREHAVADQPADERREERGAQRQVEVRRQDEHEQRDAEVRPEQRRVERSEHSQALGDRLDSPTGRCSQSRG